MKDSKEEKQVLKTFKGFNKELKCRNHLKPRVIGYKVFSADFKCRDYQFSEHSEHKYNGTMSMCNSGFHFCLKAQDCFSYYSFNPENIVCEVEAIGKHETHSEDTKIVTDHLKIGDYI